MMRCCKVCLFGPQHIVMVARRLKDLADRDPSRKLTLTWELPRVMHMTIFAADSSVVCKRSGVRLLGCSKPVPIQCHAQPAFAMIWL
mmetsp:Transcript_27250/g.59958  ORF Transcript_27250/g.59958 Transcript_27250/m.59958 type:complete len:87 (+) Transcript_27250:1360-1620(+)